MSQIQPATHEAKGHLYYHPREDDQWDGLAPYWAVADLLVNEFDGYREIETTIDGEHVVIDLAYSKSGFSPRLQDDVAGDRLYEFELHIEGRGQRKCHFNLSPRFPNMRHYDTGDKISVPFDHLDAEEGLTVQFQASNVDLDELPGLLPRALFELAETADLGLHHRYFDQSQGGRIHEVERYVRLTREWNRKLIQKGGLFDRLAMLLSTEDGTKGKHTWDNTEEFGYHHQVRLDSAGARTLFPTHHVGRQLKSYLPENPGNFDEGDPLYHPKFGVLYRQSLTGSGAVTWGERADLLDELDETLINALTWAEIPVDVGDDTRAGGGNTVFLADDHFDVVAHDRQIPISEDPTPRLEAEQDHLLLTVLRDMTSSDSDIVETLATDGGQHVEDVADNSGYSLSTVYRALQRLDGVLESKDGHVRFVSQKIAEDIRGIVQSAEHAIESAADRAAKLYDIDVRQSASSAFDQWLARYGADFVPPEGWDDRATIRIDTVMSELKSRSQPFLPDALDELVQAWVKDGRQRINVEELVVQVDLASGESYNAPISRLR